MLCFDVYVNGRRLCRAGVESGGTSAILHCSAGSRLSAVARGRSRRDQVDLDVGGLFSPRPEEYHFPKWVARRLKLGDEVTIRLVQARKADHPKRTDVETRAWVEERERAYFERLKKKYEGDPVTARDPSRRSQMTRQK
jgi:hypothetical protein